MLPKTCTCLSLIKLLEVKPCFFSSEYDTPSFPPCLYHNPGDLEQIPCAQAASSHHYNHQPQDSPLSHYYPKYHHTWTAPGGTLSCLWCPAYFWAYKVSCLSLVSFTLRHLDAEQVKACTSAGMRDALWQLNPQGAHSPFVFSCSKMKWGHAITPSAILLLLSPTTLFIQWEKPLPRTETRGSSSPSPNTGCV